LPKVDLKYRSDSKEWEHLVFAEVLIPEVPNVYGDFWSREAIKECAYRFMKDGFGVDVNHDNVDMSSTIYLVESFIARDGDADFIPGSWVVGMYVGDEEVWQQILSGELNGYSYEAFLSMLPAVLTTVQESYRTGVTEPYALDGHTHNFYVEVDDTGRPVFGGTDIQNGHSHTISNHTITDESNGHTHRYNFIQGVST
jgi:hypothetical protein